MPNRLSHVGSIDLEDGSQLVLSDYSSCPDGVSNLRRLNADGSLRWAAELRNAQMGHYVSVEVDSGRFFANSFDAYAIELDPATGTAIAEQFTK